MGGKVLTILLAELGLFQYFVHVGCVLRPAQNGTCLFGSVKFSIAGECICKPCLKCPTGFGLSHHCNNFGTPYTKLKPVICIPCKVSYYARKGYCVNCHRCRFNELEVSSCTAYHDRTCRCKKGYYPDPRTTLCTLRCSKCLNGTKEENVSEDECIGMPENMHCKQSETHSAAAHSISTPHWGVAAISVAVVLTVAVYVYFKVHNNKNTKEKDLDRIVPRIEPAIYSCYGGLYEDHGESCDCSDKDKNSNRQDSQISHVADAESELAEEKAERSEVVQLQPYFYQEQMRSICLQFNNHKDQMKLKIDELMKVLSLIPTNHIKSDWWKFGYALAGDDERIQRKIKNLVLSYANNGGLPMIVFKLLAQRHPHLSLKTFLDVLSVFHMIDINNICSDCSCKENMSLRELHPVEREYIIVKMHSIFNQRDLLEQFIDNFDMNYHDIEVAMIQTQDSMNPLIEMFQIVLVNRPHILNDC